MVASPSPPCSPYQPNPAWLPPSISTNVVSAGSRAAEASISSGVASPSLLAEMEAAVMSAPLRSVPSAG